MNQIRKLLESTKVFLLPKTKNFKKHQIAIFAFSLIVSSGLAVSNDIYAARNRPSDEGKLPEVKLAEAEKKETISIAPAPLAAQEQTTTAPVNKPAPVASKQPVASTPQKPKATPATAVPSSEMTITGILEQINFQRSQNGLAKVVLNSSLNSAAAAKAKHMADNNYFAHTAPDGTTDFNFIAKAGYVYQAAGINLAMGDFGSSKILVDAWMNSPGHRANILVSFGREVGIGIFGKYFVMMIANPA